MVGDEVLRAVAGALSSRARADDVLVRLGGDEFVVLAPGASADAAKDLVSRMQSGLDAVDWVALAPGLDLRVSIGVATTGQDVTVEDLVGMADLAMYASKHQSAAAGHSARSPRGEPGGGSLAR
jgi:diguanylate cyclase (GGDEF)-like protein